MSNITINNVCNLGCKYCFNSFLQHPDANNITLENFAKIIDFIFTSEDPSPRIGIIGGEPTIHPQFEELIGCAVKKIQRESWKNPRVPEGVFRGNICIFTNGIALSKHIEYLAGVKEYIGMLINVNSPDDIGKEAFKKLQRSLEELKEAGLTETASLGINYYKKGFDTAFLEELLYKYRCKAVRIGVPAPTEAGGNFIDNMLLIKDDLISFIRRLNENGVKSHFDCQKIPVCLLTEEEIETLRRCEYAPGDLVSDSICTPVIDIKQDMTAIRCFGLSGAFKPVPIANFDTYDDLIAYFRTTYDGIAKYIPSSRKCRDCYLRKTGRCNAGCLTYKTNVIGRLQEIFTQSLGCSFESVAAV